MCHMLSFPSEKPGGIGVYFNFMDIWILDLRLKTANKIDSKNQSEEKLIDSRLQPSKLESFHDRTKKFFNFHQNFASLSSRAKRFEITIIRFISSKLLRNTNSTKKFFSPPPTSFSCRTNKNANLSAAIQRLAKNFSLSIDVAESKILIKTITLEFISNETKNGFREAEPSRHLTIA